MALSVVCSAHLSGLFAGAALALFVDYRRPGVRASITTAWRVLQIGLLAVIVVAGYEVVRNFNRPLPALVRTTPNAHALIFLNYVNAMNQLQEKVSVVIRSNNVDDVALIMQNAMQAPVPDERADELRNRLVLILSNLANAAANATPAAGNGQARPPQADQKLVDEFNEWRKEYDQWLQDAAKAYTAQL